MKIKKEHLLVISFFLLLLLPNLAGLLYGGDTVNLEKRELAPWPDITPENYEEAPATIESYIDDHAPFRYETLNLYAKANWKLFHSVDHEDVIAGKDGWLFYAGEDSVRDVLGLPVFTEDEKEEILRRLLEARSQFVSDPENFVLFIAPNKEQVYREYLPDAYAPATGTCAAEELVQYIRAHSDLKVVYPLEELNREKEVSQLYYRMDTHWNRAGGLVGTQALLGELETGRRGSDSTLSGESETGGEASTGEAETGGEASPGEPEARLARGAEMKPLSLADMELVWETGVWRGDLADMAHLPDSEVKDRWLSVNGYLDDIACEETADGLLNYGSAPGAPDGRTLLMVRDSFGENMMPWLLKYFRKSTFVHCNYLLDKTLDGLSGDVFVYEVVERDLSELKWRLDRLLR